MKRLEQLGVSPAPWEACEDDAPNGYAIDLYGDGVCRCNQHEYATTNLHLIAAAPELYEALRECVSQLAYASVHPKLKDSSEVFTWNTAIVKANKALRKAGGAE